jgi:hypothetical protein
VPGALAAPAEAAGGGAASAAEELAAGEGEEAVAAAGEGEGAAVSEGGPAWLRCGSLGPEEEEVELLLGFSVEGAGGSATLVGLEEERSGSLGPRPLPPPMPAGKRGRGVALVERMVVPACMAAVRAPQPWRGPLRVCGHVHACMEAWGPHGGFFSWSLPHPLEQSQAPWEAPPEWLWACWPLVDLDDVIRGPRVLQRCRQLTPCACDRSAESLSTILEGDCGGPAPWASIGPTGAWLSM